MKLSGLIETLEELKSIYGDIDVVAASESYKISNKMDLEKLDTVYPCLCHNSEGTMYWVAF